MCRSVSQFVLAAFVTLLELVVSICSIPILCHAWRANRSFLVSASVGAFVSAQALANLWMAAFESMRSGVQPASSAVTPLCAVQREGDADV